MPTIEQIQARLMELAKGAPARRPAPIGAGGAGSAGCATVAGARLAISPDRAADLERGELRRLQSAKSRPVPPAESIGGAIRQTAGEFLAGTARQPAPDPRDAPPPMNTSYPAAASPESQLSPNRNNPPLADPPAPRSAPLGRLGAIDRARREHGRAVECYGGYLAGELAGSSAAELLANDRLFEAIGQLAGLGIYNAVALSLNYGPARVAEVLSFYRQCLREGQQIGSAAGWVAKNLLLTPRLIAARQAAGKPAGRR